MADSDIEIKITTAADVSALDSTKEKVEDLGDAADDASEASAGTAAEIANIGKGVNFLAISKAFDIAMQGYDAIMAKAKEIEQMAAAIEDLGRSIQSQREAFQATIATVDTLAAREKVRRDIEKEIADIADDERKARRSGETEIADQISEQSQSLENQLASLDQVTAKNIERAAQEKDIAESIARQEANRKVQEKASGYESSKLPLAEQADLADGNAFIAMTKVRDAFVAAGAAAPAFEASVSDVAASLSSLPADTQPKVRGLVNALIDARKESDTAAAADAAKPKLAALASGIKAMGDAAQGESAAPGSYRASLLRNASAASASASASAPSASGASKTDTSEVESALTTLQTSLTEILTTIATGIAAITTSITAQGAASTEAIAAASLASTNAITTLGTASGEAITALGAAVASADAALAARLTAAEARISYIASRL